jgi:hypothetical protein
VEIEYTVEVVGSGLTHTRRLTVHDPSELVIERMIDRVLDDFKGEEGDDRDL